MDKIEPQKIYFPNLNGIRFIAALLVIIHHVEQLKSIYGLRSLWDNPFIGIIGGLGVRLFFVLSGFLITFLLLSEEDSFKTIDIQKFYIRRVLRIWPLYFLIGLLAFFILPNISLFTLPGFGKDVVYQNLIVKLFLYLFFFPNLVLSIFGIIPYASQTWSIGTEEQFYLVWPILLKLFKKNRLILMVFVILSYLAIPKMLKEPFLSWLPHKDLIKGYWLSFTIDCMAIGGIFAVVLFKKNRSLRFILNNYLFYTTLVFVAIFISKGTSFYRFNNVVYSILFGIIIINFAANKKLGISLENKLLNYLGKISYGLYMYHPIAIVLTLYMIRVMGIATNWVIYPLCVIISIVFAGLSYRYYESYFLKFKNKFSNILSGK